MRPPGRSTPKVKDGRVQRKNRWTLSPHSSLNEGEPVIEKEKPGEGGKHYLKVGDVRKFIRILPDWGKLSLGLQAIVLAKADDCLGWHRPGIVALCAWTDELFAEWEGEFVQEHRIVLDRINVVVGDLKTDVPHLRPYYHEIRFTPSAVKAFQLMHVLLHELGHHHDRMTTRTQKSSSRGEKFAEDYAINYAEKIWDDYYRVFSF